MFQVLAVSEADPFAFGWEALVALFTVALAVATGALAGFTAWLGKTTKSVAQATRDEAAASWRPVITLPAQMLVEFHPDKRVRLKLFPINGGAGIAFGLDMQTGLQRAGEFLSSGILAVGEQRAYDFDLVGDRPERLRVLVDYLDLADRKYSTAALFTRGENSQTGVDQTPVTGGVEAYWFRLAETVIIPDRHLIEDKGAKNATLGRKIDWLPERNA